VQSAVSGLNRGLAANEDDLRKVDGAAKELEAVGGLVDLSVGLDKLQGRWKLIYSSAFSSRTLGGSRPGPPIGRLLPITLGQVSSLINKICYYCRFIALLVGQNSKFQVEIIEQVTDSDKSLCPSYSYCPLSMLDVLFSWKKCINFD